MWDEERSALKRQLESMGFKIPPGTTLDELRQFMSELQSKDEPTGRIQLQAHPTEQQRRRSAAAATTTVPSPRNSLTSTTPTNDPRRLSTSRAQRADELARRGSTGTAQQQQPTTTTTTIEETDETASVSVSAEDAARFDETLGEGRMDNFARPTRAAAKEFAQLHQVRGVDGKRLSSVWSSMGRHCPQRVNGTFLDPCGEGSVSELSRYGAGMSLHLKNVKFLFVVFCFASICTLPQLVANGTQTAFGGIEPLFSTTFGNLRKRGLDFTILNDTITTSFNSTNLTAVETPLPDILCLSGQSCIYTREELAYLYTTTDLVMVGIFCIGLVWLRYFVERESHVVSKLFLSLSHYSVYFPVVPRDATDFGLATFIEEATGEPVREVNFARRDGELIDIFVERGEILSELYRVVGRAVLDAETPLQRSVLYTEEEINFMREERLERQLDYYDLLLAHYHALTEQTRLYLNKSQDAVAAVVTFETQLGYVRAMRLFRPTSQAKRLWRCLRHCGGRGSSHGGHDDPHNNTVVSAEDLPPYLGVHLLAQPAPPPSTILWENFDTRPITRLLRQGASTLVAICALGVSLGASFGAQAYRSELTNAAESLDVCAQYLQSINSTSPALDLTLALATVESNGGHSSNLLLQDCYCSSLSYSEASSALANVYSSCFSYYVTRAPLVGFTIAAAAVISGVNIVMGSVMRSLTTFERHKSLMGKEISVALRLFLAYTINTGFVILLVNVHSDNVQSDAIVGNGSYDDFTSDWYANVGVQILVVSILNVGAVHFPPLLDLIQKAWMRKCGDKPLLQREMNDLYLGDDFPFALRTAQLLMQAFVALMFGAGLPLLYPIAAFSFLLFFFVDKWMILNFYRIPPEYDESMARWFVDILFAGVVVHVAFAIWMYSLPGMFWVPEVADGSTTNLSMSQQGTDPLQYLRQIINAAKGTMSSSATYSSSATVITRITLYNTLPMLFVFGAICFVALISWVFSFFGCGRGFWSCLWCLHRRVALDDDVIEDDDVIPPLKDALKSQFLRGLRSYNILKNPKYKKAFGIPASFASKHKNVVDVIDMSNDNAVPEIPDVVKAAANLG